MSKLNKNCVSYLSLFLLLTKAFNCELKVKIDIIAKPRSYFSITIKGHVRLSI